MQQHRTCDVPRLACFLGPLPEAVLGLTLLLAGPSAHGWGSDYTVTIAARPYARSECPMLLRLPDEVPSHEDMVLLDPASATPLAVQRLPNQPRLGCFILPQLPANTAAELVLRVGEAAAAAADQIVSVERRQGQIVVSIGANEVLHYNAERVPAPAGVPEYFARSGYIHPLRTPGGAVVTGDFPADHLHQHALFFAWVQTRFHDHVVDFWNQAKQEGQVEHREIVHTISGPVFGEFVVRLVHSDMTGPEPVAVLHEEWRVRVYNVQKTSSLIDFQSTQRSASHEPLEILPYHYGGFAFRGPDQWLENPEHDFLTSLSQGRATGNHSRPRWVDAYGPVNDRQAGLAILGHPDNFRFPQPVRLHPTKPYFCFSPQVVGGFEIGGAQPYISRYRLLAHDGTPSAGLLEEQWHDYANMTHNVTAHARE